MALKLGKSFNRNYNLRISILDGNYNVGVFFDKHSTFLLFTTEADFSSESLFKHNIKVNMFKNLESSKFCETFIKLHNFRNTTLDISNQFEKINDNYTHDISFILNESLILSKVLLNDKEVYDILNIYGFTINSYNEEYIFILTERHNILKRLGKKVVRTSGIQIATTPALDFLDEYHAESKLELKSGKAIKGNPDEIIKFNEVD